MNCVNDNNFQSFYSSKKLVFFSSKLYEIKKSVEYMCVLVLE